MIRYPLLELCARIDGHPLQHERLKEQCRNFHDWQGLLEFAEREGMSPLLKKHSDEAECELPVSIRRSLSLLAKRHRKNAEVRLQVLKEVLTLFESNELQPIVIKGAALCTTLYTDPGLRPMRDIDLLFRPSEVDRAQALMRDAGFVQSTAPIPSDHYHLPSLQKKVNGVNICFELHRGLYPNCPPYYPEVDVDYLLQAGKVIEIGGCKATTFNDEETLHYLYQHAFRAPLTYEHFKLINAADIISFVEKHFNNLDWQQRNTQYPILRKALPMLHHITPFDLTKVPEEFVGEKELQRKVAPVPFNGWPNKRRKELRAEGSEIAKIFKETFLPSKWWQKIYYGATGWFGWLHFLLWKHPKTIYWWIKLQKSLG